MGLCDSYPRRPSCTVYWLPQAQLPDDAGLSLIGVAKSTVYAWMEEGLFPASRKIGPRAVAWPSCTVYWWLETRP